MGAFTRLGYTHLEVFDVNFLSTFARLAEKGVAHRGLHGPLAFQNSPLAFRLALEWGYPFETDVHLSKDGELFLIHDHDLIYQTGEPGIIEELASEEIASYSLPDGTKIMRLGELLEMIHGRVPIVLELKAYQGNGKALAAAVESAIRGYGGELLIISFNEEALFAFPREKAPRGLLIGGDELRYLDEGKMGKCDFLDVAYPLLDDPKILSYRKRGGKVLSWTIRDELSLEKASALSDAVTFEGFRPFGPDQRKVEGFYLQSIEKTMNGSLLYLHDLPEEAAFLEVAGASEYQLFLNGKFLLYGPERGAKGRFYVDEALLPPAPKRRLAVLLTGSNAKGYERVNEPPFLFLRLYGRKGELLKTLEEGETAYRSPFRLEKVARFSYQRAFSEAYRFDYAKHRAMKTPGLPFEGEGEKLSPTGCFELNERRTHCPRYEKSEGHPLEGGTYVLDESLPVYDDRSMHAPFLGMYEKKEWEVAPSDYLSKCVFEAGELSYSLTKGRFLTYDLGASQTGFPVLRLKVNAPSRFILAFDEVDTSRRGVTVGIDFKRNGTMNLLYYELTPGTYELTGFLPVSGRYFRLLLVDGWIEASPGSFSLIRLENPDYARLSYRVMDAELQSILEAAVSSFRQDAVDLLMDCPSRERAGWLCDTYFTGRAEALITGENVVEKAFLDNFAHYVNLGDQPPKMIPMCHPSDYGDQGYIPNWPMFYVLELFEAYKRNHRTVDLSSPLSRIDDFLSWCEGFEDEDGFLEDLDGVVFVEWSHANDLESTRGVNFPTNMLYSRMLEALASLYPDRYAHLKGKVARLEKAIKGLGYDGQWWNDNAKRGEDGRLHLTGRISEVAQYYALHFGYVPDDGFKKRVHSLLGPRRDPSVKEDRVFPANMFIGYYLRLSSLLADGEYAKVIEECRLYFGKMALYTGTLWEYDSFYASLTHGFTSFAVNLIVESLTGISFISEGKKEVRRGKGKRVEIDCSFSLPLEGGRKFIYFARKGGEESLLLPPDYRLVED